VIGIEVLKLVVDLRIHQSRRGRKGDGALGLAVTLIIVSDEQVAIGRGGGVTDGTKDS